MSITVFVFILFSGQGTAFKVINLLVFKAYSVYFYNGLFYKASEGNGLAWWFYHLMFLTAHALFLSIFIFKRVYKWVISN